MSVTHSHIHSGDVAQDPPQNAKVGIEFAAQNVMDVSTVVALSYD